LHFFQRQGLRLALHLALHHVRHRSAFQRKLVDQPLMRNVLADLAIEAEGAMAYTLRLGRAIDQAASDPMAAALARIGTAIGKYWVCKRAPAHIGESLECLGGAGYVEESGLPRLCREAPLNGIWEGSGNVICLDVQRAMQRDEAAVPAVLAELDAAKGGNALLDRAVVEIRDDLADVEDFEIRARVVTQRLAVALQASLLVRRCR
jgi:putative acyl-CoA dehydrogenase